VVHLGKNKSMKRTTLAVALILSLLFSLVAGLVVVKEAKANSFIIFKSVAPIPGTIPPIITISSPKNNTVYPSNTVYISFNISKPEPPTPLESGITTVRYKLDAKDTGLYFCNHYNSNYPPGLPNFTYSKNLTLPEGNHTLLVNTGGVVIPGNMTIFSVGSSSTVFFTVDTTINLEQNIPEFPSWTPMLIMLVTVVVVAVVYR
jgi:hypothetical protein